MTIDPEIEPQYVFSDRFPSRRVVYAQIADDSVAARNMPPVLIDVPYGPHPRERIDLFPGRAGSPLLVFIHGGYWRSQHKDNYSFVSKTFRELGFSVAVVGYPLTPEQSLSGVVQSLRQAMQWMHTAGRESLTDWQDTIVAGHSAGGHLAAMLASDPMLDMPITGCLALSGLFDLTPLARTSIGAQVGLDDELISRMSPLARPAGSSWLIAAVGANETAAFHDQASRYVQHWSAAGGDAELLLVPGADHYSILLQLADGDSPVLRRVRVQAGVREERL